MAGVESRNCPSCQGEVLRRIGKLPETTIFAGRDAGGVLPVSSLFRCLACGLLFRHPVLAPSAYNALYGKVDPGSWSSERGRADWPLIEDYIALRAGAGADVLDFGCHTGGLLRCLGPRYARSGVEVNETAARIARETSGAKVFPSLESLPTGMCFDFVTAVDVVEHFADPGSVIASLLGVVKPGGVLVITTGDADSWLWRLSGARWWYCHYPEHLAFVSEHWIRGWLKKAVGHATLADVRRFRYLRHTLLRYALQSCMLLAHLAAPRGYAWLMRRLKRALGRQGDVEPPGVGLTEDHLFVAIRKLP